MDSENGALRTPVLILFLLAAVWIAALLQRGLPLAPDELEFFRATRWTSLGQLPFRDFWEHHTPLQWLMFAPVARLASGAGANAVVLMRWAQVSLWIATLWMLVAIARRAGARACGWAFALLLLLLSPTFLARALEYRVDVPGHFFFVAAIYCTFSRRWIAFGALMSAAVLANMRLAPLVMFAGALALFWPRWNPRALRMAIGIVAVVAAFFAYLAATGSMPGFIEGVIGYNRLSSHVLAVRTFADALFAPFMTFDLAGIVFWLAGAAGAVLALREFHERGPLQFLAMIAIASVAAVAAMQVQYDYHFQTTWVLLLPLAARAIERLPQPRWRHLAVTAGIAGWLIGIARLAPDFGAAMRYQNDVMLAADRLTSPGETVFDGGGYALRRAPAWEYWFLTTGVRFLALRGAIPRYDAAQMAAHPPAAIIADYRLILYLQLLPRLQAYALRHYIPVYRNLWIPGMTATVGPSPSRFIWTAPRAGTYDVIVSDLLAKHPWFTRPVEAVTTIGPRAAQLEIPLARLPHSDANLQWRVDGAPVAGSSLALRKGARVELTGTAPVATGILLVPHGITNLFIAPEEEIVF